jgi:histidinol-phosphate aminotransferase
METAVLTRRGLGAGLGAAMAGLWLASRSAEGSIPSGLPADTIQLNSNENPYGPSPAARAAFVRSFGAAGRYPDAREEELVGTLAKAHGVGPEQILLGCGSGDILRMADEAFLDASKKVLMAQPTFEAVVAYNRVTMAEVVKVPLDSAFRHDLPRMAAACDAATSLVYLCNPNNPTGTVVPIADIAAFLRQVPPSVTVLLDEAYIHFLENPATSSGLDLLAAHSNLIVLRTFSKIYGLAGLRLGYAVAARDKIEALARHASFSNANSAVIAAALASLAEPGLVPRVRRRINHTKRWLTSQLAADGRRFIPSEANFVMIDVGRDMAPLAEALKARKILVGRRISSMPTWLRVSVGTPEEMAMFMAALRELVPAHAVA